MALKSTGSGVGGERPEQEDRAEGTLPGQPGRHFSPQIMPHAVPEGAMTEVRNAAFKL